MQCLLSFSSLPTYRRSKILHDHTSPRIGPLLVPLGLEVRLPTQAALSSSLDLIHFRATSNCLITFARLLVLRAPVARKMELQAASFAGKHSRGSVRAVSTAHQALSGMLPHISHALNSLAALLAFIMSLE